MTKRIVVIVASLLVVEALAASFYLANTDNASTWYVRVDDAVAQDKSDEGGELWEYALDAYDATGSHRLLSFTAGKRLRDGAYLKVGYLPVREVVSWEEVQPEQLPQPARDLLG